VATHALGQESLEERAISFFLSHGLVVEAAERRADWALLILTVPTNAPDSLVFGVTLHSEKEEATRLGRRFSEDWPGRSPPPAISTGISSACMSVTAFVKLGYQAGKNPCLAATQNAPPLETRILRLR